IAFVISVWAMVWRGLHWRASGPETPDVARVPEGKENDAEAPAVRHPRHKQALVSNRSTHMRKRRTLSGEERNYVHQMMQASQWLLLAACSSILLVVVTNQITLDVAPIPLLWVLPLGLYLVSYVISFSLPKPSLTRSLIPLFSISTLAIVYALSQGNRISIPAQLLIHNSALFIACLVAHGELARLRPEPYLLTAFYLITALGGVLGTVLVNLAAPLIFTHYWEYHLGFLFCWALLVAVLYLDPASILHKARKYLVLYVLLIPPVTLLLFTLQYLRTFNTTTVLSTRNFYGTLRLQERSNLAGWESLYVLSHGTTIHGMQFKDSELRKDPIAYFNPGSGIGRLLTGLNQDPQPRKVGILGLGVGTLAAYGREQDLYRFYEINPDVVTLAEGMEGYFTYLANSPADIDVVLGDARLSLEIELTAGSRQNYDVLVLDVFSGDAVPVHLLTEECFDVYLDHLAPEGVIAAQASTTHVNIIPLLSRVAQTKGLYAIVIEDAAADYICCPSRWVLMSRSMRNLSSSSVAEVSRPIDQPIARVRLWTDNYSNPLQVLYR
ncbi:MAG: hypothetical protein P1S60_07925, partial [Anaerolineae bacterium]|nr:hypothetical protein [Anaerolineae bacterium]